MTHPTPGHPLDDFFIPYRPLPPAQRRFLRWFLPILVLLVLLLGLGLPGLHQQYGPGRRQPVKQLKGLLLDGPGAPQLLVPRPPQSGDGPPFIRVLLAGPGKTSPPPAVMDHRGQWVQVKGALFKRGDLQVMNTRQARPIPAPAIAPIPAAGVQLGPMSLVGEIVDGKCFSGVMKPGAGKTHSGCAIRCISGGVPAVFHVQNAGDQSLDFVLVDRHGKSVNNRVLPLIARSLRIDGEVTQYDNLLVLQAEPDRYLPLSGRG